MNKIFYLIIFGLLFGLLFGFFGLNDVLGYSFVGITSDGVEIPIILQSENTDNDGEGDGTSILDGMGIQKRIIKNDILGTMIFGSDDVGETTAILPYQDISASVDFAAVIETSDVKNTFAISNFWKLYEFSGTSLVDVTPTVPNILGYSDSNQMTGTNTISIQPEGIHVSGTGIRVIKINPMGGTDLIYRATMPAGASIDLVESPNDLSTLSYDGSKFVLYTGSDSSSLGGSKILYNFDVYRKYQSCGGSYGTPGVWSSNGLVYTKSAYCGWGELFIRETTTYAYSHGGTSVSPVDVYIKADPATAITPSTATYSTSDINGYKKVNSISKSAPTSCGNRGCVGTASTTSFAVKDSTPYQTQLYTTTDTEMLYTIPEGDLYLMVKPNGGTVTIKGEATTSITSNVVNISGLDTGVPYDITQNGSVIASGITSTAGTIVLNSIDAIDLESIALLNLYPNSLVYEGGISGLFFDTINDKIIHTSTFPSSINTVFAWVQVPIVGTVEITDVNLDDTLQLDLNGNYTDGFIHIPVIPSYNKVSMQVNGLDFSFLYSNVLDTPDIIITDSVSSTRSLSDSDNSISEKVGTYAFAIATGDGNLSAKIDMTTSGSSSLAHVYELEYDGLGQFSCYSLASHSSYVPCSNADPWVNYSTTTDVMSKSQSNQVEIHVNGKYRETVTLAVAASPIFRNIDNTSDTSTSSRSFFNSYGGYSGAVSFSWPSTFQIGGVYTFPSSVSSKTFSVSVEPGDFVEFFITSEISESNSPAYAPPTGFSIVNDYYVGRSTVTIDGASIQMS
jgi:hypothetical protein